MAFVPMLLAALTTLASANTPDTRFSTIDDIVVGGPLGIPIGGSPAGYDVVIRDLNLAPVPGVFVTLRFPAAMKVYATQNAGTTVDCAQRTLTRITDTEGHVNFAARLGGWTNSGQIEVSANGVVLGNVKGRSVDYNADGQVSLGDFVTFSEDFMNDPQAQRSDFDLSGTTGLGDLVLFSRTFLASGPPQATCP